MSHERDRNKAIKIEVGGYIDEKVSAEAKRFRKKLRGGDGACVGRMENKESSERRREEGC